MDEKRVSKFLSLVLRHQPEKIGITLDSEGWVDVDTLLGQMSDHGKDVSHAMLRRIVADNEKQRFAFSEDGSHIRANQGHSVKVDLKYPEAEPPELLYHGTVAKFIDSIKDKGLIKMNRLHVHLSKDEATALTVGSRRGKAVILTVKASMMYKAGLKFYLSANGVWLTDNVPPEFLWNRVYGNL